MNKQIYAVSALIGTVIGAGILGIPYVAQKSGFGLTMLNLVFLTIIICIVNLYLGEIALRTRKNHHLTGYASQYLGKKGRVIMLIGFIMGIYSAVLAYLIGQGESLSYIFFSSTEYTLWFGIAFWLVLSFFTYRGLKALKRGEFLGIIIISLLVIGIIIFFISKINLSNLTYNNFSEILTPFGVILFSLMGFAAIPEIERILGKEKYKMKRTIITSYISCFIIYTIFTLVVLGTQGINTPEVATLSLGPIFILLGIITMFTSYLALSIALIDMLRFDLYLSKKKAWLITSIIPLFLFIILELTNSASFTKILSFGGLISGGMVAILILTMVKHAKQQGQDRPAYSMPYSKSLIYILSALFAMATILEIISLF